MKISEIKLLLKTVDDEERIIRVIDNINLKIGKQIISELSALLSNTRNFIIKDKIALLFHDLEDPIVLPVLISEMNNPKNQGHIGTLLYACEAFDCTDYLEQFIYYITSSNYEIAMTSVLVIKQMKGPFDKSELRKYLVILKNHLNQLDEDDENISDVITVIVKWLKNLT